MNSAILHLVFGAERGGVERDVLAMCSYDLDVEHTVVVLGDRGVMVDDWQRVDAKVEILGRSSARPLAISGNVRKAIRRHQPDGVIAWFGMVHLPQIIRVCNQERVKLAVHAGNPAHKIPLKTDLRYQAMSWLWPAAGPLPVYACCSDYVSRSFKSSRYLRHFPRTTIYNGIELPSVPTHQPKSFDPSRPFVIGMTARLNSIKDHATLLRAFALIAKKYSNVRLELAGDGDLRSSLESLARELSIADKVSFLGDVSDVYSVMSHWDLFAYSTTEHEGLGNAVSEAMALGLPCVVSDVGPMRELMGNGNVVQHAQPNDPVSLAAAINSLIPDLSVRTNLGESGRKFATLRFEPLHFSRRHMKLLRIGSEKSQGKILHIVFGAARGGVEGNARAIISGLPDIEHTIIVLGDEGPMIDDWRRAGAQIEILGKSAAKPFAISRHIRDAIRRHHPDGVIAWFGMVQLPQIIRACNQEKVKLVVHAGNPAHNFPLTTDLRYKAMSWWWPAAGPLPVYACCSDYVSQSFESSLYLRQFPRTTIYNGIELPQTPAHIPKALDPKQPFLIGMTARLNSIKDHPTLLRAFAIVVEEYPNARLELAGDGDMRFSLESLARELSIADKVHFLGEVSDIYSVMSNWDLFAYSTTEREGLGNALSEAMALGLPCVVTEVGPTIEFQERTSHGPSLCLVPPAAPNITAETLCRLIPDVDVRRSLGIAGRETSRKRFGAGLFALNYAATLQLCSSSDLAR